MKKSGFTLAEVLITLTIIGVIAALTIPNLMQKWSDHADVVKVKEAYSILSNAMKQAIRENGEINDWQWPASGATEKGQYCMSILTPYLKIQKDCSNTFEGACQKYQIKRTYGANGTSSYYYSNYYNDAAILQNGMILSCPMYWTDPSSTYTSVLLKVDINSIKGPNRIGYDIFYFPFKSNGTLYAKFDARHCNALQTYSIADANDGMSCVNWIIKHGNVDYKYRDVSAEW